MRIGVVHMTTQASSADYGRMVEANLARVAAPDTELVHTYVKHLRRATDSARPYPMLLNQADITQEVTDLAAAGVDAVLIACSGDPAVQESRCLVDVPVVGPMEATVGLALGYGWKFGLLTVNDPTWSTHLDRLIHAYQLQHRYVGKRTLHTPTAEIFTTGFATPQLVVDDMRARAAELVADGADAIVIGSGGLCAFATYHGFSRHEELDVPVFDMLAVGVKYAEMRASLSASLGLPPVGRAGWNERFPDEDIARVRHVFSRRP
ncbi:Asp/Glu/hydantoin racemase [Pseudonocardia thermophila]|uniref:Asp/Glu/hydantoin racemase n=1 Tax=Pseudonocardia thermophila TaxID=1848 RepID=A0A1M6WQP5_PSETH|nr:aspartate/glutamate racemase family protein [Pseudonocardia thermophila]SHK96047.1 Asp/Glu/hydantoin racemase [Pseudonocardia thermophila]